MQPTKQLLFFKIKGITKTKSVSYGKSYTQAERYRNNNSVPFVVTSVITVTSTKVDLVRKMISEQSELLKQGIAITGGDYRLYAEDDYRGTHQSSNDNRKQLKTHGRQPLNSPRDSDSELGKIKRAIRDN